MDSEKSDNTYFEDIRPLNEQEFPIAVEHLLQEEKFEKAMRFALKDMTFEEFSEQLRPCKNTREFQRKIIMPFLFSLAARTTNGISLEIGENTKKGIPSTYISNHRDIILDAGFFNILLLEKGLDTTEIAIGDNLLIYPWIRNLVRMNKSFIVQRGVSKKQVLEVSKQLSAYIHYVIQEKKESVWIAQREGRAKDSNDRTQDSLLKMLTLYNKNDFLGSIRELNIVPLSISYEYDPCDYLKAAEFQSKRDNPEYKKQEIDDLINMQTGLFGYKGKVYFHVCEPINSKLDAISESIDKNEQISAVGKLIDSEIHKNYRSYPVNYIALDMLEKNNRFSDKYTQEEKNAFESYLTTQIDKINIPDKDNAFLSGKIVEMYSNPLKNKLTSENS